MDGKADDADINIRALIFALLALACGHMLSTLLRTIPGISLDVMAADFRTPPQTLASLTSIYHFAFAASQIPVGAAMDRFGVRPVSLSLLAGTIVGALASGLATGPESFLFGQFLLGVATSGMLMCPMTLAAKQMSAARFGLWSGIILSIGNIGMLLSASPLAFVVELWGWRAGFWISAGFGAVVAIAVFAAGPETAGRAGRPLLAAVANGRGAAHRPVATAARPDRAVAGVARGLAGAAGIVGRAVADGDQGAQPHRGGQYARPVHARLDRRTRADGNSRSQHRPSPRSAGRHAFVCRVAAGRDGGRRAALSAVRTVRRDGHAGRNIDGALFVLIGIAISTQPLLYGMTRQLVDAQNAGKALSAINLAFFLGAALMQSTTGVVATLYGLPAVLLFMAATLIVGTVVFVACTQPSKS